MMLFPAISPADGGILTAYARDWVLIVLVIVDVACVGLLVWHMVMTAQCERTNKAYKEMLGDYAKLAGDRADRQLRETKEVKAHILETRREAGRTSGPATPPPVATPPP